MCWCFLINMKYINICCLLLIYLQSKQIGCSEFPERECCDPIYPLIPDPEPLPPALPTTTISSTDLHHGHSVNPTGRSGEFLHSFFFLLISFHSRFSNKPQRNDSHHEIAEKKNCVHDVMIEYIGHTTNSSE